MDGVPRLSRDEINRVRRFIVFVDSVYESRVKLVLHAEAHPEDLFRVDLEDESCDEVFAFDRTRSRLEEMRSESYLKRRWRSDGKKTAQNESQGEELASQLERVI